MTRSKEKGLRIVLAVAVLLGTLAAVVSVEPAAAFCKGEGNSYWWSVGWARERSQTSGTCDGLGDYWGQVTDWQEDGNCVDLYSKDDFGSPWTFEKRSCTVGVWMTFNYDYTDENAYFKVCKNNSGACSSQTYNWGF